MKKPVVHKHVNQLLYLQVANYISKQIEIGSYVQNKRLPSINTFSAAYGVSRDTTERAYKLLIDQGYITAIAAKGYFVNSGKKAKLNVLFIMNKLSSYKKIVYYSFLEALDKKANVDLQVHHYDPALLSEILESSAGRYHYYVIMPHFFTHVAAEVYKTVLSKVPREQLLLLDKRVEGFDHVMGVYQDFENDIYDGLSTSVPALHKYKTIELVFPENSNHPTGIITGVQRFCQVHQKNFKQVPDVIVIKARKGVAYIFVTEDDLAIFIKQVRKTKLLPGKDIGIISFNETVFKELLDITVMTTDFEQMGRTAANLILYNTRLSVRNDFRFIQRNSL